MLRWYVSDPRPVWDVVLVAEVNEWYLDLVKNDHVTADRVADAIDLLVEEGPALGRPLVDRVKGSSRHNMKELRPASAGASEVRILFVFDPVRRAVLLLAGDKAGAWQGWYDRNIALAEERYQANLEEIGSREYE